MTSFCQSVSQCMISGTILQNNMILTLLPASSVQREATKMDTKQRDHMAGGRLVNVRQSLTTLVDENHNFGTEKSNGQANHKNSRNQRPKSHIPVSLQLSRDWNQLILTDDGSPAQEARMRIRLEVRRHSSSSGDDLSDTPRSPRSRLVPEAPSRVQSPSPQPQGPLSTKTGVQQYENIPVPGIIPLSRATSSPTPPQPQNLFNKDLISFYSRLACLSATSDKQLIIAAEDRLKETGFYYDNISAQEAKKMLHAVQVGTFLVRISSQQSHFFALSVKTNRGTTSIRIAYDNGGFRLDADPDSIAKMPAFDCVVALIEHYVVQSASDARNKCVFLESSGRRDTPVILTRPLKTKPQSLRHLCRRTLHYNLPPLQLEDLLQKSSASVQVRQYLQSYPYAL